MLANLFGNMGRTRFSFRKRLKAVERLLSARQDPVAALRRPWRYARTPLTLVSMLPKKVRKGPVLDGMCSIGDLPQLVSWREDGGPFITLPQAYSEHPGAPGFFNSNLGMYRIQLGGNEYIADREVGFHYHIHRGIGPHHAAALARGEDLAVNVFVGGPPAMTMAAIMPLPEGVPEICFAGALAGSRMPMIMPGRIDKNPPLRQLAG